MKKLIILTMMVIILLPFISAVELNDSVINATGLPLTINITTPIYFTSLTVNANWIEFINFTTTDGGTELLSYNLTLSGNYTESELPQITTTTSTQKVISSNILNPVNTSAVLNVDGCNITSLAYTSGSNNFNYNPTYSCSEATTLVTIPNLISIESGSNTIGLTYTTFLVDTCRPLINSFIIMVGFVSLIILLMIGTFVTNFINSNNSIDFDVLIKLSVGFLVFSVTIIIAMLVSIGACNM